MAIKISIINWKGGVGKTTFTHHLGTGLQHLSWSEGTPPRVLLVDLDAQCSLSISCLNADYFEELVYLKNRNTLKDLLPKFFVDDNPQIDIEDFIFTNSVRSKLGENTVKTYDKVDLIASHQELIFMDMIISQLDRPNFQNHLLSKDIYKFKYLYNIIKLLDNEYDIIFFDCPPNLNFITQNALFVSDYYLIPTILDRLSTYGIMSITNKVNELNELFSGSDKSFVKTGLLGIVANNVMERSGEPKASHKNMYFTLNQNFGDTVFKKYVTNGDGITSASEQGLPVYGISGTTARKQENCLFAIIREMLERLEVLQNKKQCIKRYE